MLRLEKLAREPGGRRCPSGRGRALLLKHTVMAGGDQPIGAVRDLPVGRPAGAGSSSRPAPRREGPLLVFFHGGGWVYGDLDSHDPACRFLAERSGVRILSVDYRLAPEHPFPAAYDDAVAAYRWVVEHAASLGGTPPGSASAATRRAATWPRPPRPWRPRARGCPWPSSCWSTPAPT